MISFFYWYFFTVLLQLQEYFTKCVRWVMANDISSLLVVQRIGCFRDTSHRAIKPLDGKLLLVRGNYQRRKKAIAKCALAASRFGFRVFGVQHGGWCASDPRAFRTYAKYGRSNRCRNGKGGPWANDVYRISGLLCFSYHLVILSSKRHSYQKNCVKTA